MELRTEPLQSGISYSLYEFFGPNRVVIVPDLQRDYCWATTYALTGEEQSLVESYIDDLISASKNANKPKLKMGLLYGYEYPSDNVQLCDGQQRLTTLFLTTGVCLVKIGKEDSVLKEEAESLLSFENSSRLQYAIRDSTLSFINNLVDNNAFYSEISNESWFSNEYNRDPSVINMILAIKQIESKIKDVETAKKLLNYILHDISFLYFDMQSRLYSEEQYVILNTTGYSLTPTEHIKPRLLGKLSNNELLNKYSELWDSWEQFIWEHRPIEYDDFTVDEWFDRFLTVFYLAEYVSEDAAFGDRETEYSSYQRVLQGKKKYIFPSDTESEAIRSLEIIDKYFSTTKLISKLNLSVVLDLGSMEIPSKNIWEFISGDTDWKTLSNLQQVVTVFIQISKIKDCSSDTVIAWSERILEFAWVQSRYKNENQDVCQFLSFADQLSLSGESIYSKGMHDNLFSAELRTKKFPLLATVNNDSPISEIEKALQLLAHLKTSEGKISYALDMFENPQPEDFYRLARNLADSTEEPDTLLRRSLMTYGAYWDENGWCKWGDKWGKRYDFAPSANYFYSRTHDKQNKLILSFIRDIADKQNVRNYFQHRIETLSPALTDDDSMNRIVQLLFKHEEFFDFMQRGRIAVVGQLAFAMSGLRATGSYLTIMDPRQRELVEKTKSLLGDSWSVWNQFTLAKEIANFEADEIEIWVSGDWHILDDGQFEFRSYVSSKCNDRIWQKIRSALTNILPAYHDIDDDRKYFHCKVLRSSSYEEAASVLESIYIAVSEVEWSKFIS